MNFKQFFEIKDALQGNVDIQFKTSWGGDVSYSFTVNNILYNISFDKIYYRNLNGYEVAFGSRKPPFYFGSRFDITNDAANPFKVYSILIQVIKKFIISYNPEVLQFHGFTDKQQKLYDKFYANYLSSKYEKYDYDHYIRKDMLLPNQSINYSNKSYA